MEFKSESFPLRVVDSLTDFNLRVDDPLQMYFQNIDWHLIASSTENLYADQGASAYDPVSLSKALLLIYLYSQYAMPLREKLRDQAEIGGVRIRDKGYEIRDIQAISYRNVEFDRGSLPRFKESEMPISTALKLSLRGVGFLLCSAALILLLSYFKFAITRWDRNLNSNQGLHRNRRKRESQDALLTIR